MTKPYFFELNPEYDFLQKWSKRPMVESKMFKYEDLKKKHTKLEDVIKPFGWNDFLQMDKTIYIQIWSSTSILIQRSIKMQVWWFHKLETKKSS